MIVRVPEDSAETSGRQPQAKLNAKKEVVTNVEGDVDYKALAEINTDLARIDSVLAKIDP